MVAVQRDDDDDEPLPTTPRESPYMRGHSSSVFPSLGARRRQSSNENYIEMLETPRTPPTSASRRQTMVPGGSGCRSVTAHRTTGTTSQRPTRPAAMSSYQSSSSREQPWQDHAASHGATVAGTSRSRQQHGGADRGMHLPLLGSQQGRGAARQSVLYPDQDSPVTTSTHFPAQPRGGGDLGVEDPRSGVAFIGGGGGGSDTDGEGVGATAPRMPGSGARRNYCSMPASVPRPGVAAVPVREALVGRPEAGGDLLTLNVGGQLFSTTQTTLLSDPESMLGTFKVMRRCGG